MAIRKKNTKMATLRQIEGSPGLYTFDNISRDFKQEQKIVARIVRDAQKRKNRFLVRLGI